MNDRVIGHYDGLEKIGEGGMGEVFRAIHPILQRTVAIKSLRPELSAHQGNIDRFHSEAMVLARLNHPNIATLYDFLSQEGEYFMVMEFIDGIRLDEMIQQQGALDWQQAGGLMCQALDGLEHAHERTVIHRDIKPANMILDQYGRLKLIDFGIARRVDSARMTQHGHLVGTLEYMSPEQIRGHDVDARSDVYGLGAVFYELLTGQVPFDGESDYGLMTAQIEALPERPSKFKADVPKAIETIVLRALNKVPKRRFQNAAEFRAALKLALNQGSEVFEPKAMEWVSKVALWREYPGVWGFAVLSLMALSLVLSAAINQWMTESGKSSSTVIIEQSSKEKDKQGSSVPPTTRHPPVTAPPVPGDSIPDMPKGVIILPDTEPEITPSMLDEDEVEKPESEVWKGNWPIEK